MCCCFSLACLRVVHTTSQQPKHYTSDYNVATQLQLPELESNIHFSSQVHVTMSHTSHRSFFFDIKDIYHVDWDDFDLPLDMYVGSIYIHKVAFLAYVLLHMYGKYICIQDLGYCLE